MIDSDDDANPAVALIRLSEALASGELPAFEDRRLLVGAVHRWIEQGVPLELALGLRGMPCQASARTIYRRAEQHRHLRAAHALCEGATPWARAVALAEEIHRFHRLWPAYRDLTANPDPKMSRIVHELFMARKLGELPETARGLSNICYSQ
ncbi:hypothetical protein [uncultured Lamprocystis sp.]|uniref:hypothetical protein n=1 Tax=uncultured Lamprocystis sp. TaxID=543132 RepID=UPI0025F73A74|nr:hypothetical protein [uncultured Lamprocystis sp.]